MKRLLIAALLIAAPSFGQIPGQVTKVIKLKAAEPDLLTNTLRMFGVEVMTAAQLKTVTLRGTPAQIEAAEAAIKQLDIEPKNIELVAYFVVGSDQPNITGAQVPTDVRDVVTQLKSTFAFKEYRMLD